MSCIRRHAALRRAAVVLVATTIAPWTAAATAAEPGASAAPRAQRAIEEVIVTARKRAEPLQSSPVAVTALSGDDLRARFPADLKTLQFPAPNVNISQVGQFTNAASVFIRGIGFAGIASTFDPPVANLVNGVYIARPANSSLALYDVEQVEILRGPQGTLFGRNSTAGAIHVRTRRPTDEFGTRGRITAGEYGRRDVRAAINLPLVEGRVAARLAIASQRMDGYQKHGITGEDLGGEDIFDIRPTITFSFGDAVDWTLIGEYHVNDSQPTPQHNISDASQLLCALHGNCGVSFDEGDPRTNSPNENMYIDNEIWGITSELNWEFAPGTLTSILNYRETESVTFLDIDNTSAPMFATLRDQPHEQASAEVRFVTDGYSRFDFIGGVYLFRQEFHLTRNTFLEIVPGTPTSHLIGNAEQEHRQASVFAEVDYHLSDAMTLTAGGRLGWEEKDFWQEPFGPFPQGAPRLEPDAESWTDFSPKIGLQYRLTDAAHTYATWTRGFKSGGWNARGGTPVSIGPFDPEEVDAYEIGLKSDWFADRLRVNVAAFWNEFDDLQRTKIRFLPGQPNPQETVTDNAAAARIRGLELEVETVPTERLSLRLSASYLDAEYDDFCADLDGPTFFDSAPTSDCGGLVGNVENPGSTGPGLYVVDEDQTDLALQYAPEWQTSMDAAYELFLGGAGSLQLNGRYTYVSELQIDVAGNPKAERDALHLVDASVTYRDPQERFSVSVFGKNLTDQLYLARTTLVAGLFDMANVGPPRRFGVELRWEM